MAVRNSITRDLHDSIRNVTGPKVKITLSCMVKLETKSEKMENRVLVFTPCRLIVFTAKVPTKIDFHIHYLDLRSIESKKANVLALGAKDKVYTFHTYDSDEKSAMVDGMIKAIVQEITDLFPGFPLDHFVRTMDILPPSRVVPRMPKDTTGHDPGPCGNFARQYACMCDYLGLTYREEVAWDIDTIYHAHESKELNLKDFDHLEVKDLVPIIAALEHNRHFTSLRLGTTKLSHEAIEKLLHVVKKSSTLEELYADNASLKLDFAHKLSLSVIANQHCTLHTLDLSNNPVEDKGVSHLSNAFGKQSIGLKAFVLSHCGITGKGLDKLSHSFALNRSLKDTLTRLDLSGNVLKDDINHLCPFLAQPNVLVHFNLSSTESSIEPVFGALARGCTSHLSHLNFSKCSFVTKKGKELPPSFKQFFSSTIALKYLSLAGTRVPPEALKALLLGLACNDAICSVELDLSGNALSAIGAHVLDSCIHGVRCVSSLDISDNGLEGELANIMMSASRNKSLKSLNISRNLQNLKSKHVAAVTESIVNLLQEDDCSVEVLLMADCRLRCETYGVINALETNRSLVKLDISGNTIGDAGARLLGKALQINTVLQTLVIDRNSIGFQGLCDITYALESNHTLRHVPIPLHDISVLQKSSVERTEQVVRQLQDLLSRNSSMPARSGSLAFRLQHSYQLNSTHQTVDRLYAQTLEALRNKEISDPDSPFIEEAKKVLSDVSNAKKLLRSLYDLTKEDAYSGLRREIASISSKMHSHINSQLQAAIVDTLNFAEARCPELFRLGNIKQDLQTMLETKISIKSEVISANLMDKCAPEISSRINEALMSLITAISERVIEETIHALSKSYKSLVGGGRQRLSTPDVSRVSAHRLSTQSSSPSVEERLSVHENEKTESSPVATPSLSNVRRCQQSRKLRPKSVVDTMNHATSAETLSSVIQPVEPVSINEEENEESTVSEMPLRHLGLNRPRRLKTRMPTKPTVRHPDGPLSLGTLSPEMELSEGFDSFFGVNLGSGSGATSATSLGSISEDRAWSRNASADSSPQHRPSSLSRDLSSHDEKKSSSLPRVSEAKQTTRIVRGVSEVFDPRSKLEMAEKNSIDSGVASAESKSREELSTRGSEEKEGKKEEPVKKELQREEPMLKRKNSGGVKLLSSLFGRTSGSDIKDETGDEKKSPLATKKQAQPSPLLAKAAEKIEERKLSESKADESHEVPHFKIGGATSSNTFLSDLKSRQEKRTSFFAAKPPSEEEKQDKPEKAPFKLPEDLTSDPSSKVKMRLAAFTENKPSDSEPPLPPKPGKALLKAPPLAPKPRPWSFAEKSNSEIEHPKSREKTPEALPVTEEKEEEKNGSEMPKKSVKELAASLNRKPEEPKTNVPPAKLKQSPLMQDDMTRSCHAAFGDFLHDGKGIKKLVTDDNEELGENVEETHGTLSTLTVRESAKKPSGSVLHMRLQGERIIADDSVNV